MKRFIVSIAGLAAMVLAIEMNAQEVKFPHKGLLEDKKYEKAEKRIMKDYASDSTDALNCYAAYRLFSDSLFRGHDNESAYYYLIRVQTLYNAADEKRMEKINKKGLTRDVLAADMDKTTQRALRAAINGNTIAAYEHFLNRFGQSITQQQRDIAAEKRDALELDEARGEDTEGAYKRFVARRPLSSHRAEAEALMSKAAYRDASASDKIEAYERFVSEYPKSEETPDAWGRIYDLAYESTKTEGTEYAYRAYAAKYKASPHASEAVERANDLEYAKIALSKDWRKLKAYISQHSENRKQVEMAKDAIAEIAIQTRNIDALDYGTRIFDGTRSHRMARALHDIYANCYKYDDFYERYGDYVDAELYNKDRQTVTQLTYTDTDDPSSIDAAIKAAAPYRAAYVLLLTLIDKNIKTRNWKAALKTVQSYKEYFADDPDYNSLLATISAPNENDLKVTALQGGVNTSHGDEYAAFVSADDKTIYFTGKNRKDNLGGEDIFVSRKGQNGIWGKSEPMPGINSYYGNESPEAVSADGTTMLLFKNGKLMASEKTAYGWTNPEELPDNINIADWQADAMITSDGQAMIFAARKKTECELETSDNIFVSQLDENGNWSEPVSLGATINTPGIDRSPFLHPDMKTLYFSSDRHGNLGGLDVFKSTRLNEDSWTEWSEPVNLGKEINTAGNDCWYRISTDGKRAYFTKEKDGLQDLYQMNLPIRLRPNMVATVSGHITDHHQKPVAAELRWEDLQSGNTVGHCKTDPADGSYFIVLPLGRIYGYYVSDDDYFPVSKSIDLRNTDTATNMVEDIPVVSFEQMIEEEIAVPINNLFFNVGKADLLPLSVNELKRVATIIKKQGLRVEIAGHTDDTGTEELNQGLSERRAMSVKNFLVKQGCNESLIQTVGYGSSRPIAPNDNEKNRRLNRRVEMRFTGK